MKNLSKTLTAIAGCALIALAIYWTKSAVPLWALFLLAIVVEVA